jgi:hypothetical protein
MYISEVGCDCRVGTLREAFFKYRPEFDCFRLFASLSLLDGQKLLRVITAEFV